MNSKWIKSLYKSMFKSSLCLCERVEQFKYFGATWKNQNSIHEESNSILKSENACYHSVVNLLSSSLLSKNINVKNYNFACFVWVWNLVADTEGRT
jgi:hypothetical protein